MSTLEDDHSIQTSGEEVHKIVESIGKSNIGGISSLYVVILVNIIYWTLFFSYLPPPSDDMNDIFTMKQIP